MNIAVLDAYHEFHFEVIQRLQNKPINKLSYLLTGSPKNFHGDLDKIKNIRESIIKGSTSTNEIIDFLYPSNILKLKTTQWNVDVELLEKTKAIESLFLRLTDRSAALPISVHQRRFYFLNILNYFYGILKDKSIDCLICFDTPHSFPSNCLYELAKLLELKIIRLEYHYLPDYSIIIDEYEMPAIEDGYLDDLSKDEILDRLPENVKANLTPTNSFVQSYIKAGNKEIGSDGLLSQLKLYSKYISKYSTNIIQGILPFLFKDEILHFTSLNEIHNRLKYRWSIRKPLKELYKLNLYYNKIAITPNLATPFVYLGLHMQPEKTSMPLGGEFGNQFLIIKMIADGLPEGWKLYVKDHPNQFNLRKIPNAHFRSKYFYDAIAQIENVELVSLTTPSNELIKQSKLIATITGTTGMEALTTGKAVLCFGEAYYKACKAVCNVKTVEDIRLGIDRLSKLKAEEIEEELARYVSYYLERRYLVEAANWESKLNQSKLDRDTQINNLTEALNKFIK